MVDELDRGVPPDGAGLSSDDGAASVSTLRASIPDALNHDEAINALCNCAATVTVLSYQEAIEGYFALRGWQPPHSDVHDLYDRIRDEGFIDPILVRASIVSQIGEECPFPTQKAMADHYGVHAEQLRMFIRGLRPELEPKLAAAFGLERVVFYRTAQAIEAGTGETRRGSTEGESAVSEGDVPDTGEALKDAQ